MTQRLKELLATQALPHDGIIGAGSWCAEVCGDSDITVREGVAAQLLIVDGDCTAEVNIDVERGGELRILHVVSHRSAVNVAVAMAEGAKCIMSQLVVSPSDTRVVASLMGRDAHFDFGGAFVLTDDDAASVAVDVNHISSDCVSRTVVKGVASGESHGSFSGLVYVAPDAQRTNSEQLSRNITIGNARIETLPQLEIYADDVKCSHGATVGQMDADAILYMRQRGLSLATAKRLQIEGFVDDVVLHLSIAGVEDVLMELMAEKLNRL